MLCVEPYYSSLYDIRLNKICYVFMIKTISSSGKKKELVVFFDEKDVVKKYNMSESNVKVRNGLLNQ